MEKKKIIGILIAGVLILLLAGAMEVSNRTMEGDNLLMRGNMGDGEEEISLVLDAQGVLEDYPYSITVEERIPTYEEVTEWFAQAKKEIDDSFCRSGETLSRVTECVQIQKSYVDGRVSAEWYFDDYDLIDVEGKLIDDMLDEEGSVIGVQVELRCDEYCELYCFSFMAYPRELNQEEQLLASVRRDIEEKQAERGADRLELPGEVDGIALQWHEEKQHMVLKVLLMELLFVFLIPLVRLEKEKKERKERAGRLLLGYPDMISKLTVLVGSGMSVKQAWNRISARYSDKRQKNKAVLNPVYEEMLKTSREMEAGESERTAYQRFGERTGLHEYHRFVRILIQNLQKGTGGLCELLEKESETAFEERRMLAKKLGEEAGTKMLFPLILMMGIVMAIVIAPAIIGFMN